MKIIEVPRWFIIRNGEVKSARRQTGLKKVLTIVVGSK